MKYFQHQGDIYQHLERGNKFVQLSGVFGRPLLEPIPDAKPIKNHRANAIINEWHRANKAPKWEFQGEWFRHLDYLNTREDFYKLPFHENPYPLHYDGLAYVYHQGRVLEAAYHANSEGLLLINPRGKNKYCSVKNVAPVFNITQKCII